MPTRVTPADGYGERDAALVMVADVPGGRVTLSGDKGYDYPFVAALRRLGVTAHVAQNLTNRRSAIDARTTVTVGMRSASGGGDASKKRSGG
jgi:hypothetical protein